MVNKILGLLGISAKAGKVISGTEIVTEYIKKNKVKLIIVAEDTSEKTKKNIEFLCDKYKVKIKQYGTIEENSKHIGKKNRAIIGILDEKLANKLASEISGGENFGEN